MLRKIAGFALLVALVSGCGGSDTPEPSGGMGEIDMVDAPAHDDDGSTTKDDGSHSK